MTSRRTPRGGRPPTAGQRIADIIAYGVLADHLGLDIFGVGEHHGPDFAVSSPAVVQAAVAQSTQSIRLTSTATVLSTLDPVRVYQDFATVDLISGGRAELTAGRSAFTEPFALFGEDMDNYDALFEEKLGLLLRLRAQDRVTWSGRFRPALHDAAITPRAHATELPIWVGVGGTQESARRAGRLGLPMFLGLIGGTIQHARRIVDIYREAGEAAGHASTLRLGISSHFFVGHTSFRAREDVYPYYRQYLAPKTPGGRGGALVVGGPEEVAEKLLDMAQILGADRFMGQVDFGGMPRPMVESSIALFANQVAPLVRRELGAWTPSVGAATPSFAAASFPAESSKK